ncbi:MAG: type III-B CRISPR module-associated protein Cmr5 [Thiofilum sp.]|uniref:type III-B CRISPR module-associated protein Cmr5 n=1 Tax=Thiofilum sp. TaxID=2212733 RepID=UPI0025E74638|nr:type III-B CRISPR module-associated protein Cmr5 [Thiofilum sp.]MBK8455494.1 type III-B CRISPR module-associated protein Cmr5 [Thiofilum sp.]
MATLDQQRATFAWAAISEVKPNLVKKEYTNLAKAIPTMMMSNGLMQTLAFLQAKNEEQHQKLLAHILNWLDIRFSMGGLSFEKAINALHYSDSATYMQLTNETMALLRWIRQFADARKAMG